VDDWVNNPNETKLPYPVSCPADDVSATPCLAGHQDHANRTICHTTLTGFAKQQAALPLTKIKVNGKDYEMQPGESVLATLIRNGLNPPYSCHQGNCMTCMSQVLAGEVPERSREVLLEFQKAKGLFLACVCYPEEDIEIALRKSGTDGTG
jgi:ferredoxin